MGLGANILVHQLMCTFVSRSIQFALGGKPSGIHYVPEYISEEMEGRILELVDSLPDNHPQWVQVRGRRLQCYGGKHVRSQAR